MTSAEAIALVTGTGARTNAPVTHAFTIDNSRAAQRVARAIHHREMEDSEEFRTMRAFQRQNRYGK